MTLDYLRDHNPSRFPGMYRAKVVETNDPTMMHRIRFKCPDLHDHDLKTEECPWATICSTLGGDKAGSWHAPVIGDFVWIQFDHEHSYGPVVVGFADPTRRMRYPLASIYGKTPLPVDENGEAAEQPQDYNEEFLPKDGRPMSWGRTDRYGNTDVSSAIGYFPVEHKEKPPTADYDEIAQKQFEQSTSAPLVNDPDLKFMLRMSKYGHVVLLGDQGYQWYQESGSTGGSGGSTGEFTGDPKKDAKFEQERWKYIQRLINEDKVKDHDQRRLMLMTRYGHKFEMRDVGWNKTRDGEYGESTTIGKGQDDHRWIKIRSKGGMLFQLCDKGFDVKDDEFVKRKLLDEVGDKADGEAEWKEKDSRWIRLVTRHGYKIVLDDRGSDSKNSETKELPHGNGVLIKGRRTQGAMGVPVEIQNPTGFFWEFNENDLTNQTTWGSPAGLVMQISDKQQYIMLASRNSEYPQPWQNLKENEFLKSPLVANELEKKSHHLKLDHANEFVSLKTRAANGEDPFLPPDKEPVNKPGVTGRINAGIEMRDGEKGDGPWVEIVDSNGRNFWMSTKEGIVMCHAKTTPERTKLSWWMDEKKKEIVIRHDESSGRIQIFSNKAIEVISTEEINMKAKKITMRADEEIVLATNAGSFKVADDGVSCLPITMSPAFVETTPSIVPLEPPEAATEPKISPTDRGKRYNTDQDVPAPDDEISHPI